jgi:hypothetical protein
MFDAIKTGPGSSATYALMAHFQFNTVLETDSFQKKLTHHGLDATNKNIK